MIIFLHGPENASSVHMPIQKNTTKYVRQDAQAIQGGYASKSVLEWYEMRLNKMDTLMMRNRRLET